MYLKTLKLWNFRQLGNGGLINLEDPHFKVEFNQTFNLIVGKNNTGKTAVIDAIKLVLKSRSEWWIKFEKEDFYLVDANGLPSGDIRIELEFRGFDKDGKDIFPFMEWMELDKEGELFLRVFAEPKYNELKDTIYDYDIKAGADGKSFSSTVRELLRATYLKPLRDANFDMEARKNSRLSQILIEKESLIGSAKEHHLERVAKDQLVKMEDFFDNEIDSSTCSDHEGAQDHFEKGNKIFKSIQEIYKSFSGGEDLKFAYNQHSLRQVLENFSLGITDPGKSGLGSQNLMFMAAELLLLENSDEYELKLALVEELEAHLHVQNQMRVAETLQVKAEEEGIQMIITTHSPHLASKIHIDNLIYLYKNKAYRMSESNLSPEEKKKIEIFLDATKANLFFTDALIFVEGPSEEVLLPVIARKLGEDLTKSGVSIVNVGHKFSECVYEKLFQYKSEGVENIPIKIVKIRDADFGPGEKYKDSTLKSKLKSLGIPDGEFSKKENGELKKFYNEKLKEDEIILTQYINVEKKKDKEYIKNYFANPYTLEDCIKKSNVMLAYQSVKNTIGNHLGSSKSKAMNALDLAVKIEASEENWNMEEDDSLSYLKEAIQHVCSEKS